LDKRDPLRQGEVFNKRDPVPQVAQQPVQAEVQQVTYQQLPREIRKHVDDVRASCKELNNKFKPYDLTQGVTTIDLEGARALMVDNEGLCNDALPGANCSNRGCDLKIWKEDKQTGWRKIFDDHLHRKFISTSKSGKFQLMAISVWAGKPECQPNPREEYSSGQSCDLLVSFHDGKWSWQLIR
jgi:hypothetical protein